jgi:hypothetical protein
VWTYVLGERIHAMAQAKPTSSSAPPVRSRHKPGAAKTAQFMVSLPQKAAARLAGREAKIKALMEMLSERIAESETSGQVTSFLVEVDAHGQPHIRAAEATSAYTAGPPATSSDADDELEQALAAARARGRHRAAEILAGEEMLSADAFADLLGVSRVTVNAKRQKHEVLALEGARRGFRFPAWQLDENGRPFAVLPQIFDRLGESPWTVYRFLVQHHPELDGESALDALRRGRGDDVVDVAESVARGAFT